MAKKEKKSRGTIEEMQSKKSGCGCGGCALTAVILLVVFVAAIVGGSFFAWGKFVEPKIGVSLKDTISIVTGLYKYDESSIVTNPYDKEKDLNEFYGNLKTSLFLAEDCNIEDSVTSIIGAAMNNTQESAATPTAYVYTAEEDTPETTGSTQFDAFLKDLKFDFSSLKDYEDEYKNPNILSLTDKQLAAFMNASIVNILSSDSMKEQTAQFGDISNAVDIAQIIIDGKKDFYNVNFTATVKINIREAVKGILAQNNIPTFLASLLPKALYGTIKVYPNDASKASEIKINDYDNDKMGVVLKIIDTAMGASNTEGQANTIESMLVEVNAKMVDAIAQVQQVIPIEFVDTGAANIRPIKTLMNMMGVTEITETQFFCMIRDIALPTFDDVDTTLGFADGVKFEEITSINKTGVDNFIGELESKYALNNSDKSITSDNIYTSLTNVSGEQGLVNKIDVKNLSFEETYDASLHKAKLTYAGLTGVLNNALSSKTTENNKLQYEILSTGYDTASNSLKLTLAVNVSGMIKIEEDSSMVGLIQQLVPEYIFITAKIGLDAAGETVILINNCTAEQTEAHLNTMIDITFALGTDLSTTLKIDSLKQEISNAVKDGFSQIEEKLGTTLVFTETEVSLPGIYEVVAGSVLHKDGEEDMTDEEVFEVFKGIQVIPDAYSASNMAEDLSGLVNSINTKYYLTDTAKLNANKIDEGTGEIVPITTQLNQMTGNYKTVIDGPKLAAAWGVSRVDSETELELNDENKALVLDSDYTPTATAGELAKLMDDSVKIKVDALKDPKLDQVYVVSNHELKLVLKTGINAGDGNNYTNILPNEIAVVVIIDLDKVTSVESEIATNICCSFTINGMTSETINNFKTMMARLGSTAFNIDDVNKKADEQIDRNLGKLLKDELPCTFETTVDGGVMKLGSIYDITAKKINDASVTAVNLADTVTALHTEIVGYGQKNITADDEFNTEGAFDVSHDYAGVAENTHVTIKSKEGKEITGRNLGYMIKQNGLDTLASKMGIQNPTAETLAILQTAFINSNTDGLTNDEKGYYSSLINELSSKTLENNSQYALVTFAILTKDALGDAENTLLPERLYVSGIIEMKTAGNSYILFNNLTSDEVNILSKIANNFMGSTSDFLNISNNQAELNDYVNKIEIYKYTLTVAEVPVLTATLKFSDVRGAGTISNSFIGSSVNGKLSVNATLSAQSASIT